MKRILLSMLVVLLNTALFAQTSIPTMWDVSSTTLPDGWTTSGTDFYSSGTTAGSSSVKMNGDDQFVQVFFADEPGDVTYFIKGQTSNNAPFEGVFSIQESVDGTSWNNLRVLTNTEISSGGYTEFTDTPDAASRYIRWYFTEKESGSNVALDDMSIIAPVAGANQEIAVSDGSEAIIMNGNYLVGEAVGSTLSDTLYVLNLGLDSVLNVTNVSLSGVNANNFAITSFDNTISPEDSGMIIFTFTPIASGQSDALLTIENNDSNEDPYLVNLVGYGDFLASEPVAQATNLNWDIVLSYSLGLEFTATTAEGYLVLRNNNGPVTEVPVDGVTYKPGDMIGSSKVAYSGSNTGLILNDIVANKTYNVAIFSYNGVENFTNYNTILPLTGSQASLGSMQPVMEYSTIDRTSNTFLADLQAKVNQHTVQFYSNFDDTYVRNFASRDTTDGMKVITCHYTSFEHIYEPPFSFNVVSREHSYPSSWFPAGNAETLPEFNDYHNLYPVLQDEANAVRSNFPLGEVVGTISSEFMDGKLGLDVDGKKVYEPRDEQKGAAARAMMYMAATYNTVSGNSWEFPDPIGVAIPFGQDQDVLKKWHYEHPVSDWEIARNDYIESLQDNRNPFTDSTLFACHIDFSNMTYIENPTVPCTTTVTSPDAVIEVYVNNLVSVYPNPTSNFINIKSLENNGKKVSINLYSSIGELVISQEFSDNELKTLDINNLSSGIYSLKISKGNLSQITTISKL